MSLQTLDALLQTPGCVISDPWMCHFRLLEVPHILSGIAVPCQQKVLGQNKTNPLGAFFNVVRSVDTPNYSCVELS